MPETIAGGGALQAASQGGLSPSARPPPSPAGRERRSPVNTSRAGAPRAGPRRTSQPPLFSGSYDFQDHGVPYRLFSSDLSRALLLNGDRCRGEASGECPVVKPAFAGHRRPGGLPGLLPARRLFLRSADRSSPTSPGEASTPPPSKSGSKAPPPTSARSCSRAARRSPTMRSTVAPRALPTSSSGRRQPAASPCSTRLPAFASPLGRERSPKTHRASMPTSSKTARSGYMKRASPPRRCPKRSAAGRLPGRLHRRLHRLLHRRCHPAPLHRRNRSEHPDRERSQRRARRLRRRLHRLLPRRSGSEALDRRHDHNRGRREPTRPSLQLAARHGSRPGERRRGQAALHLQGQTHRL